MDADGRGGWSRVVEVVEACEYVRIQERSMLVLSSYRSEGGQYMQSFLLTRCLHVVPVVLLTLTLALGSFDTSRIV